MTAQRRRRWRRALAGLAIAAVALALLAGTAVWWIIPTLVRDAIQDALERRWQGAATVGAVKVSLWGPAIIRDVVLTDTLGRPWLNLSSVSLELGSWRAGRPRLTAAHASLLTLHVYEVEDLQALPLRPAPADRDGKPLDVSRHVDLRRLSIDRIVLHVTMGDGTTTRQAPHRLTVSRPDDDYHLSLAPLTNGPSAPATLSGTIADDGRAVDLRAHLAHRFTPAQTALIARLAGWREPAALEGVVAADLTVAGDPARDWTMTVEGSLAGRDHRLALQTRGRTDLHFVQRPAGLSDGAPDVRAEFPGSGIDSIGVRAGGSLVAEALDLPVRRVSADYSFDGTVLGPAGPYGGWAVEGAAQIDGGPVVGADETISRQFHASLLMLGRSVDLTRFSADLGDGFARGLARLDAPVNAPPAYRGDLTARNVSPARLAAALGYPDAVREGTLDFHYAFQCDQAHLAGLRGGGTVQFRDSDLSQLTIIQAILSALGVAHQAADRADADVRFTHEGANVAISRGRLATPVLAIDALPGSTADIEARGVDLYVVVGLLEDLRPLLDLPILREFVPLAQHLTRLRVTGRWDDWRNLRVTKQPTGDVAAGTITFFRGVVSTGGDLGRAFLEPLEQVLP